MPHHTVTLHNQNLTQLHKFVCSPLYKFHSQCKIQRYLAAEIKSSAWRHQFQTVISRKVQMIADTMAQISGKYQQIFVVANITLDNQERPKMPKSEEKNTTESLGLQVVLVISETISHTRSDHNHEVVHIRAVQPGNQPILWKRNCLARPTGPLLSQTWRNMVMVPQTPVNGPLPDPVRLRTQIQKRQTEKYALSGDNMNHSQLSILEAIPRM